MPDSTYHHLPSLSRETNNWKVAYRSFARKHELTRANLRRKTALLRVLESRLDKREDALHDLHEKSHEKVTWLCRYFVLGVWNRVASLLLTVLGAMQTITFFGLVAVQGSSRLWLGRWSSGFVLLCEI